MIKIQDVVREIVISDEDFLPALANGYANLSAYAKKIQKTVEQKAKKEVKTSGVVVALSRLSSQVKSNHPLIQDVKINNITTKSPLSEIVYEKNINSLSKLTSMYGRVKKGTDDFFTMTLSTNDITVICSDKIRLEIEKKLSEKPLMKEEGLACIGLSLDPKYYYLPNITFSLIRRIARKHIPLAETITTRTEIIFVFNKKYLGEIVDLFS
ncbi:MAG: hypothetical protein KBC21_02655 [Candidatus Pacebacteria bacterium]|jgi:hypothetical protein|nr:hypothetical protein [Candidatus Paceibacterota bacterium]